MHDPTKILMGSHGSSDFLATCSESGDPATFTPGLAVKNNAGALSLSSGSLIGVSLGADLSDTTKTSVAKAGNDIPLCLPGWLYLVKSQLTFITKRNVAVSIELLDTETAGDETVTVTGDDDEGYLISVGMDSTTSTTTQIKAALDGDADAAALIDTLIASGQESTAVTAFAEDAIDSKFAVIGAAVRIHASSGKAVNTGGTLTGSQYSSEVKEGIYMDGSSAGPVAYIDMGGGLA